MQGSIGAAFSCARRARRWPVVLSAAVVALSTACSSSVTSASAPSFAPAVSTSARSVDRPAAPPASAPVAAAVRPSTTSPTRPKHSAGTAGIVVNAAGAVLPDPRRTPGAINPMVTPATIHSTICVPGWTATIRPPTSYTAGLKLRQLASGYAYHHDENPGDYEEDHLISLELGGSPSSPANLWPEPYFTADGARTKDRIENRLHALVCSGLVGLATAQRAIAGNWWVSYNVYDAGMPSGTARSTTHRSSAPAPVPVADPGAGATARCNDGTYSYAAHHQGACSHHGGVEIFYK